MSGFTEERFTSKLVKDHSSGCWNWKKPHPTRGYGGFELDGKTVAAHRASYMMFHGVVLSSEQCVLHKCDNRSCVNPDHLYVGDKKQNRKDFMERHPRAKEIVANAMAARSKGAKKFWDSMSANERAEFCKKRRAAQVAKNNGHQPRCKGGNCKCLV